ncbi:60S ribosomal protein [Yarrowia sp. B02]|nr:60S ribosomal protein [Yarrowia sp. B02]
MAPVKTQKANKYTVDCKAPSADGIFDVSSFEKFLTERIKVDGRTNQLGEDIKVSSNGDVVTVVSSTQFSGKYLKYLTKKYLKKQQLRDWIRVISTSKGNYTLKFYNVVANEEDEE